MISSVSFGKKIPTADFGIYDKMKRYKTYATLYEYDCKDKSDIEAIRNIKGDFFCNKEIAYKAEEQYLKNAALQQAGSVSDLNGGLKVYVAEKDGDVLGLCSVYDTDKGIRLDKIETRPDNPYKYTGSGMTAAIGLNMLKNKGTTFEISNPVPAVKEFFMKKCGFKENESGLYSDDKNVANFINETRNKIGLPIFDLTV